MRLRRRTARRDWDLVAGVLMLAASVLVLSVYLTSGLYLDCRYPPKSPLQAVTEACTLLAIHPR